MTESVLLLGFITGLGIGAWSILLGAAGYAKGILGSLLQIVMIVALFIFLLVPHVLPLNPASFARQLGIETTLGNALALLTTTMVVGATMFFLSAKLGVLGWLACKMDSVRIGSSEKE